MKNQAIASLIALCALTACEQIDLAKNDGDKDESTDQSVNIAAPLHTGEGTIDAPYTVEDVRLNSAELYDENVWVIGYAVGTAPQYLTNAHFTLPFDSETNILLADDPDCTDVSLCLPVQLLEKHRPALSLKLHNDMHRQCLMIQGTVGSYLRTTGIRSLTNYRWFPGFTIPSTKPEDWTDITIE